mgnify:FL=1
MKINKYKIIWDQNGFQIFTGFNGNWESESVERVFPRGFTRKEKRENAKYRKEGIL